MIRFTVALSALSLSSIWVASAVAQVHVDPGGPAGKQYSDTLDEARAQNGGGDPATAVPGSGAGEPPLFGEGVTPASGGGGGDSDAAGSGGSQASASTPDGGGSLGPLLAIVAAVVALGTLAGAGIARLSRGQPA